MIIYQKKWLGFYMLSTLDGSPALRALFPAILSCLLAVLLSSYEVINADRAIMEHPYPYQIFCFVLGFILVFRTTFAYNRYQQAITNVALMTSKWGDVALQLCCFHTMISKPELDDQRDIFRVEIVHLISLLHAVALLKMRGDNDLNNLKPFILKNTKQTNDSQSSNSRGESNYKENNDNVNKKEQGFPLSWKGSLWQVIGSEESISKYFDFSFDSDELVLKYHRANPIHVMGGISEAEFSSLSNVEDKCFLVMQWVVDIVAIQGKLKLFDVEGPIVSRIYQELSDGMLGYNQARKLTEIPFPWPYAHLVVYLLTIYAISVPFLMAAWLDSVPVVGCLTTLVVWCYFAINEVNRDIEDPFIRGPNDLPLSLVQGDLNSRLLSLQPIDRMHRLSVISRNIGEIIKQEIEVYSHQSSMTSTTSSTSSSAPEYRSGQGQVNEQSKEPNNSDPSLNRFLHLID